jgi:hypothetical protein
MGCVQRTPGLTATLPGGSEIPGERLIRRVCLAASISRFRKARAGQRIRREKGPGRHPGARALPCLPCDQPWSRPARETRGIAGRSFRNWSVPLPARGVTMFRHVPSPPRRSSISFRWAAWTRSLIPRVCNWIGLGWPDNLDHSIRMIARRATRFSQKTINGTG